ncbi:MAG: YggT family protein [Alphaproteobacteria bacterium]|nr:YggT family protein [Alphaproteobacteria bacterium]
MSGGQDIWWSYWYFHLPNYAFSVLFYTLFGRFLLGLVVPPTSSNYIYRWFCRLTDWLIVLVDRITPAMIPRAFLPPAAAFWVVVARVVFFMAMFQAGLTPRMSAG